MSETLLRKNGCRRKKQVYVFCMSVIWVPPGRTSPYQKGAGAVVKAESTKLLLRQKLVGVEASTVPLKRRQLGELVGTSNAAWMGRAIRQKSPMASNILAANMKSVRTTEEGLRIRM